MSEFRDRMSLQRDIIKAVNTKKWKTEELFGLSSKAIDRWGKANEIPDDSKAIKLLKQISEKLLFLANRSQDQVTEEYRNIIKDINFLHNEIKNTLNY